MPLIIPPCGNPRSMWAVIAVHRVFPTTLIALELWRFGLLGHQTELFGLDLSVW